MTARQVPPLISTSQTPGRQEQDQPSEPNRGERESGTAMAHGESSGRELREQPGTRRARHGPSGARGAAAAAAKGTREPALGQKSIPAAARATCRSKHPPASPKLCPRHKLHGLQHPEQPGNTFAWEEMFPSRFCLRTATLASSKSVLCC